MRNAAGFLTAPYAGSILQTLGLGAIAAGVSLGLAAAYGGDLFIIQVQPQLLTFTGAATLCLSGVTWFHIGRGFTTGRPWAFRMAALTVLVVIVGLGSLTLAITSIDGPRTWIPIAGLVGAILGLLPVYRVLNLLSRVPRVGSDAWAQGLIRVPVDGKEVSSGVVALDVKVIKMMEIRAESVFRPGSSDVECFYAVTGETPGALDTLHSLASRRVVSTATPNMVQADIEGMVTLVLKERQGKVPGCLVEIHTHPDRDEAVPSDQDLKHWQSTARFLSERLPQTQVFFGVHAVTRERPGVGASPKASAEHKIGWSSVCKDHEIAVFTTTGRPARVLLGLPLA